MEISKIILSFATLKRLGQIPEWPNGADCKSAGVRLRWFESIFAHPNKKECVIINGDTFFFCSPLPYFVLNTKSRVTACRPSSLSEIPNYVEFSKRSANGFGQILSMVFCKFLSHITLLLSPQTKSTFHSKIDSTEYLNTQISKNSTDKLCACQKNLYLCNK